MEFFLITELFVNVRLITHNKEERDTAIEKKKLITDTEGYIAVCV